MFVYCLQGGDVELVVIERSIAGFELLHNKADVTALSSTALPSRNEGNAIRERGKKSRKKRKNAKRPLYSYSTDLLGLSRKR